MNAVEIRPLLHREPCSECGEEVLTTRTQATPTSQRYVCLLCQTWKKDGDQDLETILKLEAERDAAREELEQAKQLLRQLVRIEGDIYESEDQLKARVILFLAKGEKR